MTTEETLLRVKAAQSILTGMGVQSLSLFGSRANGSATDDSDFDFAVRLDKDRGIGLFGYLDIVDELKSLAGTSVDVVVEPARKPAMQEAIDRVRRHVF